MLSFRMVTLVVGPHLHSKQAVHECMSHEAVKQSATGRFGRVGSIGTPDVM